MNIKNKSKYYEKIKEEYKEAEKDFSDFIMKVSFGAVTCIAFILNNHKDLQRIKDASILMFPIVLLLIFIGLKKWMKFKFIKDECIKNFLEIKKQEVYNRLIEVGSIILVIFVIEFIVFSIVW